MRLIFLACTFLVFFNLKATELGDKLENLKTSVSVIQASLTEISGKLNKLKSNLQGQKAQEQKTEVKVFTEKLPENIREILMAVGNIQPDKPK